MLTAGDGAPDNVRGGQHGDVVRAATRHVIGVQKQQVPVPRTPDADGADGPSVLQLSRICGYLDAAAGQLRAVLAPQPQHPPAGTAAGDRLPMLQISRQHQRRKNRMTAPVRLVSLGGPAGCVRTISPPDRSEAAACHPRLRARSPARSGLRAWHRERDAILRDLIVILASAVIVAMAVVSGPAAQGPALTAASAPPSPAAAAQVIAAYTAFVPALTAAEPQPQPQAAALLAPYAAQPYLEHVLAQMAWYRAHDEVAWGYLVPHVTSVQITGRQAVVLDCQDASNAWLVSTVTGRAIPGTAGSVRTHLVAVLVRASDGRWRLTLLAHLGGSCSPVPSPS
jgi:hypothetical protein